MLRLKTLEVLGSCVHSVAEQRLDFVSEDLQVWAFLGRELVGKVVLGFFFKMLDSLVENCFDDIETDFDLLDELGLISHFL